MRAPSGEHCGLEDSELGGAAGQLVDGSPTTMLGAVRSRRATGFGAVPGHVGVVPGRGRRAVACRRATDCGDGIRNRGRAPSYATRRPPEPVRSTATMALTGAAGAEWSSRTPIQRLRDRSMTPSANRQVPGAPGVSGVNGIGLVAGSGCRYRRPSEMLEKLSVPSATVHAPPPYSCTRVRTLRGAGVMSIGPSACTPPRTTTQRPCSCGLPSSQ